MKEKILNRIVINAAVSLILTAIIISTTMVFILYYDNPAILTIEKEKLSLNIYPWVILNISLISLVIFFYLLSSINEISLGKILSANMPDEKVEEKEAPAAANADENSDTILPPPEPTKKT